MLRGTHRNLKLLFRNKAEFFLSLDIDFIIEMFFECIGFDEFNCCQTFSRQHHSRVLSSHDTDLIPMLEDGYDVIRESHSNHNEKPK